MRLTALIAALALAASALAVPAQSSDASDAPATTPSVHRWRKGPVSMHHRPAAGADVTPSMHQRHKGPVSMRYRPEAFATPPSPLAHHIPTRTPPPSSTRAAFAPRDSSEPPPPPHGPESDPPRFHGDASVARREGGAAFDGSSELFNRTHTGMPHRHGHEGGPARLHAHEGGSARLHGEAAVGSLALDSDSEFDGCELDMELQ